MSKGGNFRTFGKNAYNGSGYSQQFTSPDVQIPMLANGNSTPMEIVSKSDDCRSLSLDIVERKGKIGKLYLRENLGFGDKKPSDRAPRWKGDLKIGMYTFSVQLWASKTGDGTFSGPVSIPTN